MEMVYDGGQGNSNNRNTRVLENIYKSPQPNPELYRRDGCILKSHIMNNNIHTIVLTMNLLL